MDFIMKGLPDSLEDKVGKFSSAKELWDKLHTLINLGHFAMTILMHVPCFVLDMAMNLTPPKHHITCHGNCDDLTISSPKR
jgi:hypothetical protein